jgi:hypothetical protein
MITNLIFVFIMGCSGKAGKIKTQSESESKVTQQELIDNWSDYTIWLKSAAVVFDPKNDVRKILVSSHWGSVKDLESWTEIVKANTSRAGDFDISAMGQTDTSFTGVREIWGPDNQLYGFIISRGVDEVLIKKVDEKSIRLKWTAGARGSAP